jgi:hypothetical protein
MMVLKIMVCSPPWTGGLQHAAPSPPSLQRNNGRQQDPQHTTCENLLSVGSNPLLSTHGHMRPLRWNTADKLHACHHMYCTLLLTTAGSPTSEQQVGSATSHLLPPPLALKHPPVSQALSVPWRRHLVVSSAAVMAPVPAPCW